MKSLDSQADRRQRIYQMMADERAHTCKRILELRRNQTQDVTPAPADQLDEARSLAEVEAHASLIEAAENRLKAIDDAVGRLRGTIMVCASNVATKFPSRACRHYRLPLCVSRANGSTIPSASQRRTCSARK